MNESLTLGQKQRIFTENIGMLIRYAYVQGYELSFGQALRTKAEAQANADSGAGISNSLHLISLAVDFNLFRDGKYLSASEDHTQLGSYWKSLHPLNRWGGDFKKKDGNHYSMEHNGVK